MAGLIIEEMQALPEEGDGIDYHGWHFQVVEKDGHRIGRVKITLLPAEE